MEEEKEEEEEEEEEEGGGGEQETWRCRRRIGRGAQGEVREGEGEVEVQE